MDFADNFRLHGTFDVTAIAALLEQSAEMEWLDSVARIAPVHRASRGLFLKNDLATEHLYGTVHPAHAKYRAAIEPILDALRASLGDGYYVRLQFSRHLPGDGFDPHVDTFSYTLAHSHRIHVPICTNDEVWFSVGGERKHMKRGEAWEINNTRVHAGHNGGATPRIHLIVDRARPLTGVGERVAYAMNRLETGSLGSLLMFRPQLEGESQPLGGTRTVGRPPPARGRVERNVLVGIHFRLRGAASGELLFEDTSEEPLQYVHGRAQLPPAFEAALEGRAPGDLCSATVPCERAFGAFDPALVARVRSGVLQRLQPQQRELYAVGGDVPVMARARISGARAQVIDANHPLAGFGVHFEATVRHVRSLEDEEYTHAIYNGPTFASGDRARAAVHDFARRCCDERSSRAC